MRRRWQSTDPEVRKGLITVHEHYRPQALVLRKQRKSGYTKGWLANNGRSAAQDIARLGLVDGLGDMRTVLRERFGEKVRLRVVNQPKGWLRRRFGADTSLSAITSLAEAARGSLASDILAAAEERALWSRYGL